jgi:hypothetical protein
LDRGHFMDAESARDCGLVDLSFLAWARTARARHGRIREDAPCRPQAFALKCRHDDEGKKAADDAHVRRC